MSNFFYALGQITKKKSTIGYFKVFRSRCFVLKIIDHDGKFDVKSYKTKFLGYFLTSRTYRVYNLTKHVVEESIDVSFQESNVNLLRDEEDDAGTCTNSKLKPDSTSNQQVVLKEVKSPSTPHQASRSEEANQSATQQYENSSQQVELRSADDDTSNRLAKMMLGGSYTPKETKKWLNYNGNGANPPFKKTRLSHEEIEQHSLPKSTRTVKNHPPELIIGDKSEFIKTRKGQSHFVLLLQF